MSDLTEFLLARIAEDEVFTREEQANVARYGFGASFPTPERFLHECEAKREIVRAYRLRAEQGAQRGGEVFSYHATGLGVAIRHLAAVYADHPDYRPEWRP